MKRNQTLIGLVAGALGTALAATAQPQLKTPGLAITPAPLQANVKDQQRQQERADREAMRKEWPRQVLQEFLTAQGYAQPELQNAAIAHFEAQENAQQAVRNAGAKLKKAVDDGVPAAQLTVAINNYKTALEENADKRQASEAALDAKIGFSKDAKLEAALLLAGVLGGGTSYVNSGPPPWAGGGKNQKNNQGKGAPGPNKTPNAPKMAQP